MTSPLASFRKLLPLTLLMTGCLSSRGNLQEQDVEELESLKEEVAANLFYPCESTQAPIPLPVPIRGAKLHWHEGQPVLVYEGIFREAVKSVWQPLKSDFSPNGDGVVIGQKEMPFVTDFSTHTDEFQGFWTSYRFKVAGSELFASAIEYLPAEKGNAPIARLGMPQARNSSALRQWVIPLPQPSTPASARQAQKGMAHVVVRTVAVDDGEEPESIYTWYILHASKGLVKKMGEFRDRSGLAIESFLLGRDIPDLVAVGIENHSDETYGTGAKSSSRTSRIFALRPFAAGTPQWTLHEEEGNTLSNLTVFSSDGAADSVVNLAWLREASGSTTPSLQLASSRVDAPGKNPPPSVKSHDSKQKGKKRFAAPPPPPKPQKRTLPVRTVPLKYVPSSLQFIAIPGVGPALTWWAGNGEAHAMVVLKPDTRTGQLVTRAYAPRNILGKPTGFSIPPSHRAEGLILTFALTSDNVATAGSVRFCAVPKAQVKN